MEIVLRSCYIPSMNCCSRAVVHGYLLLHDKSLLCNPSNKLLLTCCHWCGMSFCGVCCCVLIHYCDALQTVSCGIICHMNLFVLTTSAGVGVLRIMLLRRVFVVSSV